MSEDVIGKEGCCLICVEGDGSCDTPCPSCVCSKCTWYEKPPGSYYGKCGYLKFKFEEVIIEDVILEKQSDKAYYLYHEHFGLSWFPKSQVKLIDNKVKCPRWLLDKKGWIREGGWFLLDYMTIGKYEDWFKSRIDGYFEPSYKDNQIRYG